MRKQSKKPEPATEAELRQHPVLEGLEEGPLASVVQDTRPVLLDRGEMLFNQGDPARHFYIVRHGQIKLFRISAEGHEKIIDTVGPGGSFAEAVMFMAERSYPVHTAALESTELLAVPTEPLRRSLAASTDACFRLLAHLSRRLRQHVGEIEALSLQKGSLRLANYLLRALPSGSDQGVVRLSLSKKVIAARLSLQPETLSRLLRRFEERGLIEVDKAEIRVLDRKALREAALADDH